MIFESSLLEWPTFLFQHVFRPDGKLDVLSGAWAILVFLCFDISDACSISIEFIKYSNNRNAVFFFQIEPLSFAVLSVAFLICMQKCNSLIRHTFIFCSFAKLSIILRIRHAEVSFRWIQPSQWLWPVAHWRSMKKKNCSSLAWATIDQQCNGTTFVRVGDTRKKNDNNNEGSNGFLNRSIDIDSVECQFFNGDKSSFSTLLSSRIHWISGVNCYLYFQLRYKTMIK